MSDSKPIIVRSRDAGVIFGDYISHEGRTVEVSNARQMWRWKAQKGGTLIDCATHGVIDGDCRFSFPATRKITVFDACAMIECTVEAAISMRDVKGQSWR